MIIWDKIAVLRALFPSKDAAHQVSKRWFQAGNRDRELAADLLRLGGIMTLQPTIDGDLAPTDPQRLAYEAGRRDMALQLLAMMNLTIDELNALTEDNNA